MTDQLLRWMKQNNVPITRAKYLGLAFGKEMPDPWTPEHEAELPEELQEVYSEHGDQFEMFDKYDPNEPREPKGTPTGGQWTTGGSGGSDPSPPEDDNIRLIGTDPTDEKITQWEAELTARSRRIEEEGRIGDREDSSVYQMRNALKEWTQASASDKRNDTIGLSVVYGGSRDSGDTRLLAASLVRFNRYDKVAKITLSGAIDEKAHEKSIHEIVARYGGSVERIEAPVFGDDLETIAIFERAGFRLGPPEGELFMVWGKIKTETELLAEKLAAETRKEEVEIAGNAAAIDLKFDPDLIEYTDEDRTFELNGMQMHYAGSYTRGEPGIKIYHPHVNMNSVAGIVAHEIGHRKLDLFRRKYLKEFDEVMKDPGLPANPEGQYWWEKRGGHETVMKADGSLRAPFDKKYPVYEAWVQLTELNRDKMVKGGQGFSNYTDEYWKGFLDGTITIDKPIHETIAEMSRIKYQTGKLPGSPGWKKLFNMMEKNWEMTPPHVRVKARPVEEPWW